ncbi:MAG: response regulator [Magnetococcales bacterium]|nr:response regulator [Magnetococcales bacterium]MBF0419298.1 response regulator [Magnetococcales bacterium]
MATILIIDDDPTIRAYVRAILEEDGHRVDEATDGNSGLESFRAGHFDLIFTDILMPLKDGVEVIMELTESFPGVRIIAMSGGGRGLDASFNLDMAKDFGALHVLAKPFSPEDVRQAVTRLLT